MATVTTPRHLRSRKRYQQTRQNTAIFKVILTAVGICCVLAFLLCAGAPDNKEKSLRSKFHNFVEKHEFAGYGPSHPRASFVLVATQDLSDPLESMSKAISSILSHTDRNRILVICAIFQDGVLNTQQKKEAQAQLDKIDAGTSTHWHGTTKHIHGDNEINHQHGRKIKAMFLDNNSVAASRRDAAHYIQYLAKDYEENGLKNSNENIITVFVRPDSEIETDNWIDTATHALIGTDDEETSNAISFAASSTETISKGETKSINLELKPTKSHASSDAMSLTQGLSYPSPIVEGAVTAMTLKTFFKLPIADDALDSHFAADLEMSFNLWMCADGIDIVSILRAKTTLGILQHKDKSGSTAASVARLAYTWMGGSDNNIGMNVLSLNEASGVSTDTLRKDGKLKKLPNNEKLKECRTFEWYTKEVNVAMEKELAKLPVLKKKAKKEEPQEPARGGHLAPGFDEKKTEVKSGNKAEDGGLPLKPLSAINKEIISTAKFVDLAKVDVSDGNRNDPHRGAIGPDGNFGYIHDEKALHRNPPQFEFTREQVQCNNNDGTTKMLTKKVFVDIPGHEAANRRAETTGKPRAKIFCLVYTTEEGHNRIPAIRQSWGQKCDGFMVGSTKTDVELGTVNIPHEGPEAYGNIWQKVRSMLSYIYDNYYEEYDWFHIGGDDLYVLVENLRLYVESEEIQLASNGGERLPPDNVTRQVPLFLGRRFKEQGNTQRIFNSGGSGYTMNKAALKALIVEAFPTCMPHLKTFAEDVMVAQCFRNKLKVFPFDTKDENGGERYMPFQPKHHLNYKIPKDVKSDWYSNYSIDIKTGLDHCAANSVAFHYIKGDLMTRMHAILYGHCA